MLRAEVLAEPLRVVSIGGGHGLSTLLRGLKRYTKPARGGMEITAVVTVTDDGGSSGRLRRDFAILPPGDIRNCMVALSQDEELLARLFDYRFSSGRGLKGHSFGNLFLTALCHLTGDFSRAIAISSVGLAVAGRIYPSTVSSAHLVATLANGKRVQGETRIARSKQSIEKIHLEPATVKPCKETLQAIANADLITIGPGSLYTSLIPHLLVDGIPRAIRASKATKVYFANLMTQPGETSGMSASDHIRALLRHAGKHGPGLIDVCVLNNAALPASPVAYYRKRSARPVDVDIEAIEQMGIEVRLDDLVDAHPTDHEYWIRHNPAAIGAIAEDLAREGRMKRRPMKHQPRRAS